MNRTKLLDKSLEELYSLAYPKLSGKASYEALSDEKKHRGITNYKIGKVPPSVYMNNQDRIRWFKNELIDLIDQQSGGVKIGSLLNPSGFMGSDFYIDDNYHVTTTDVKGIPPSGWYDDFTKTWEAELIRSKYLVTGSPDFRGYPMSPDECFKPDEDTLLLLC
jgi:hypothetical protein